MGDNNKNDYKFKKGDTVPSTGNEIRNVVAQSDTCGVFICTNGEINYEMYSIEKQEFSEDQSRNISEIHHIIFLIKMGLNKKYKQIFQNRLAHLLFITIEFKNNNLSDKIEQAKDIITVLIAKRNYGVFLRYGLIAFVFMTILCMSIFVFSDYLPFSTGIDKNILNLFLFSSFSGGVGALNSILFQVYDLKKFRTIAPIFISWLGIVKILLGGICGMVIVAAIKANFFLGELHDNFYACLLLALTAGYCEGYNEEVFKFLKGIISFNKKSNQPSDSKELKA